MADVNLFGVAACIFAIFAGMALFVWVVGRMD